MSCEIRVHNFSGQNVVARRNGQHLDLVLGGTPGHDHLSGEPRRKGISAIGVEAISMGRTPRGERFRFYICADDTSPAFLQAFAQRFGLSEPVIEGDGQFIAVLEDVEQGAVMLPAIPGDTGDTDFDGGSPL